ncbi:sugar phosphate isomerase/epimerase family protein [Flectobacillus major]|jgi:sugar phosphate isomerase/epimerase|uniref:sugar phosphate isomerase/epimerase family protein n=1 Tax=Flectobacillus major TaxID=103 RepID=UPI0003F825B4|nr:sugar phosphate isomerase/epimerase [Flectobacillus major]
MNSRRDFLKKSGLMSLAGLSLPSFLADAAAGHAVGKHAIGVQLYTTMSVIDKDVEGTLKAIANIGYKEIESAFSMKGGYYGMKPKEFASLLKDLGLTWAAHHATGAPRKPRPQTDTAAAAQQAPRPAMPPMKNLQQNYQEIIDDLAEGGVKYLVCASTPVSTLDEVKTSIDTFGKAGEACKKAGLQLVFHNHTAEFEKVEGQLPYEMFISQLSSDILKFELDLAWAMKAGVDVVALFKKNPGRFPMWHVKDLDKTTMKPVEIGNGFIDFTPIFAAAKTAGVKHYFVEQDGATTPIESLTTSFNNLRNKI